jgi:hypothetical protein
LLLLAAAVQLLLLLLLLLLPFAMNAAAGLDDVAVAAVADMLLLPLAYEYERARVQTAKFHSVYACVHNDRI